MSGQPGIGVMLGYLSGNEETVETHKAAMGKVIQVAALVEDELVLRFTDNTGIRVYDDGQSCCESRYMTSDDDLGAAAGATFTGLELREAPNRVTEYGEPHEVQFLLLNTSKGVFTFETHNEHNGYYGGFWIVIRPLESE